MSVTELTGQSSVTAEAPSPAPLPVDPGAPPVAERSLRAGTKVEVRRRFDAKWARGFEVVRASAEGYWLRRLSDGVEIPVPFTPEDVRKERKNNTWWY